jgi:hypothetical protein
LFEAVEKLNALLQLSSNWDSYGAAPVRSSAVKDALSVLIKSLDTDSPNPIIVPTSVGGLQTEWHLKGIDFEIDFPGSGACNLYAEDSAGAFPDQEIENASIDEPRLIESIREIMDKISRR